MYCTMKNMDFTNNVKGFASEVYIVSLSILHDLSETEVSLKTRITIIIVIFIRYSSIKSVLYYRKVLSTVK